MIKITLGLSWATLKDQNKRICLFKVKKENDDHEYVLLFKRLVQKSDMPSDFRPSPSHYTIDKMGKTILVTAMKMETRTMVNLFHLVTGFVNCSTERKAFFDNFHCNK